MPYAKSSKNYLTAIKEWKIRNMIAGYIEARMLFKSFRLDAKSKRLIPLEELRKICSLLDEVKGQHRLLFSQPEEKAGARGAAKISPGAADVDFLANVGQLAHKVLMARELREASEHYPATESAQQTTNDFLKENLEDIDRLFDEGVQRVVGLMAAHRENRLLIAYLLEDAYRIGKVLQMNCDELLMKMTETPTLEKALMATARYYIESGWFDKATDLLKRVIKLNAANAEARQLVDRYSKMHTVLN